MPKPIDSSLHYIPNSLTTSSPTSDATSSSENKKEDFNKIDELIKNIKQKYKDFDFENWIACNDLKEKTEREIFFFLSEQYNKNMIGSKRCLNSINDSSPLIKSTLSNYGYHTDSLSDFFQEVKQSIIVGKNDYLDVLKDIFSRYMDYVRDLRTAITSLSKYSKAAKKDGQLAVDFIEFKKELEKTKNNFIKKFEGNPFFKINFKFEYDNGFYIRSIEQKKIRYSNRSQVDHALNSVDKLLKNIKGVKLVKNDNSSKTNNDINIDFVVDIDFDDFDKIINEVKKKIPDKKILTDEEIESKKESIINGYHKDLATVSIYMSSELKKKIVSGFESRANEEIKRLKKERDEEQFNNLLQTEFDLFKKSLDALEKKINSNLDELSKKYSSANSNYDNFVKIVSNTINVLLEMAKGFLRF
ncbi:IpaD/SipD/SspD family type III secretion system needle tip protein [Proteus vulgaris]|uniref:IpaD/SipD/SspD family type III secretion system needle tip protein n=1 Tax=Proteus vulgaris TaxID=585 RepID=UPI0034D6F805